MEKVLIIPDKVKKIIEVFDTAKTRLPRFARNDTAEIYIVGGSVRDLLLEREVKDWDFTTNLTPEEMKKLFPKNSFCNNEFGTFSVVGKNKEIFEITTFRTEQGYSDSRHPDVVKWGKSLEEDLQRRDFTINAIALKIVDCRLSIVDLYGGQEDLKNKLIRTVGNPDERFKEDALRLMRAVRIATQIDFEIEEKTFESIKRNSKLINNIAFERIRDELFKILVSENAVRGIELLKESDLLKEIMPELLEGIEVTQKGHHIDDVWTHNLKTLKNCSSKNPITRLACLLHDVAKPMTLKIVNNERTFYNHEVIGSRIAVKIGKRLKLSNKELDLLFRLVRWHMFTVQETQTDKAVRRFIRNVTPEYIDEMIAMRRADRIGSGAKETSWRWELFKKRIIEVQKQPFSIKDLKINGLDVMEILKIKPGKKVGEILNEIFKKVDENPELNKREILLEMINNLK